MPEGHNVVVRLRLGGNLHQLHRTLAPIPNGLHPEARTALIAGFEILIISKSSATLHQPEAAWVGIEEYTRLKGVRIDERPPQPFLAPVPDGQPFRVMDRGAKVINALPIMGAKEEHAGQGR